MHPVAQPVEPVRQDHLAPRACGHAGQVDLGLHLVVHAEVELIGAGPGEAVRLPRRHTRPSCRTRRHRAAPDHPGGRENVPPAAARKQSQDRRRAPVHCRPCEEHARTPRRGRRTHPGQALRRGRRGRVRPRHRCCVPQDRPRGSHPGLPSGQGTPPRPRGPHRAWRRRASRRCATPSRSYLAKAVREHDVDIIATPEVDITGGEEEGPVAVRRHRRGPAPRQRPRLRRPARRAAEPRRDRTRTSTARVDAERAAHGELIDVDRPRGHGRLSSPSTSPPPVTASRCPGSTPRTGMYELGQGWIAEDFDDHLIGALAGDELTFTATPSGTEEPADFTVTVKKVQELVLPELHRRVGEREHRRRSRRSRRGRDSPRSQLEDVRLAQVRQLAGRAGHATPSPSSSTRTRPRRSSTTSCASGSRTS